MDIRTILTHIQAGSSNRQIERDLNVDRRTVKRYRDWAEEQDILAGDLPEIEYLQELLEKTLADRQPPQKCFHGGTLSRDRRKSWSNKK